MQKMIYRWFANAAIIVGFFLLAKVIYGSVDGSIAARLFPESQEPMQNTMYALLLRLPVPLHVISVGLLLQRHWLPPAWAKITLLAVIITGCWLGAALAIRWFLPS